MSHKHIYNSSDGLVLKSLRGAVALNPALRLHASTKIVYVANTPPSTRIAVLSGGGAGHEPAHAGYTGHGMLTSSVSGDVFASPSAKQILAAIEFAAFTNSPTPRDVVIIINNYTGDRLNFGLAMEHARAKHPGLNVVSVLNADDVSLLPQTRQDGKDAGMVGPRGLGGNIFVCKVLGAYTMFGGKGESTSPSAPNPTLARAKCLGDALVAHLRSIGVALGHCHVPGREPHSASQLIADNHVELGLGLHNEPGVRCAPLESSHWLATEMLRLVSMSGGGWSGADIYKGEGAPKFDAHESWLREDDVTVLFINNLGGVSQLEIGAIVEEVRDVLASQKIVPSRVYCAPFMTSLNAPGFSISVVNVSRIHELINGNNEEDEIDLLALLDAPTDAHSWLGVRSWPAVRATPDENEVQAEALLRTFTSSPSGTSQSSSDGGSTWQGLGMLEENVIKGIRGACQAVLVAEPDMTRFDTIVGDGDCGETFASGAQGLFRSTCCSLACDPNRNAAILAALDSGTLDPAKTAPAPFVGKVGEILEGSMGGTAGALFAIFFTAWSNALRSLNGPSSLSAALIALGAHTPARPGDRTVVDALAPFCAVLSSDDASLEDAVIAVKEGAESTRGMKARLGRASYVGGGEGGVGVPPDPGAWGVAHIVDGFAKGIAA
ncbi:DAK1 DegV-like protein [Suillus clintonianus]|uniref:DAK1 DegV-like protein n=1 Tax=Suillus clintonianus TaxID=1904413 RepID=UPI001B86A0FB|nr:DAK1 DegV-like protein [Suillus clintonianus]KAG2148927.1 DAK1 DegV-like protein [Suillus clintonianus]